MSSAKRRQFCLGSNVLEEYRQNRRIGSGNDLAPERRQAITWTNADPIHRIYASLGRIYASVNRVSIGSDNGLSPIRRQAII